MINLHDNYENLLMQATSLIKEKKIKIFLKNKENVFSNRNTQGKKVKRSCPHKNRQKMKKKINFRNKHELQFKINEP